MNNDNALMLEALAKSLSLKKPKQVLREGDEFEDDFFSPGINMWLACDNLYKVIFFRKPGNPKGIMTYGSGNRWNNKLPHSKDNKAKFWKMASNTYLLYNTYYGTVISGPKSNYGPFLGPNIWIFHWAYLLSRGPIQPPKEFGEKWAEGFIEGEDFIFVKK